MCTPSIVEGDPSLVKAAQMSSPYWESISHWLYDLLWHTDVFHANIILQAKEMESCLEGTISLYYILSYYMYDICILYIGFAFHT